jgi:ATP adenylyltransferase
MPFDYLLTFIQSKMRMSHIYQPVMLKALLSSGGKLTDAQIAEHLLKYDDSQIEYYQHIVNSMVGKVLRSHNIVEKSSLNYQLLGFSSLSAKEKQILIDLCIEKIDNYIQKRGAAIWEHRKKSKGYIPGSIKYEVLKRAKFRCELCGVSAEVKALEVDHIVPRNLGGEDSINNYQALCYSCNSTKRDTDSTDFRNKINFEHKANECVFCNIKQLKIICENNLAFAIRDNFPVTDLHTLIIPKRHFASYFDFTQAETNATSQLLYDQKNEILKTDNSIEGFNVGVNDGNVAGQTIFHCHIHLIPRRTNDMDNPEGGVRGVIPWKQHYKGKNI